MIKQVRKFIDEYKVYFFLLSLLVPYSFVSSCTERLQDNAIFILDMDTEINEDTETILFVGKPDQEIFKEILNQAPNVTIHANDKYLHRHIINAYKQNMKPRYIYLVEPTKDLIILAVELFPRSVIIGRSYEKHKALLKEFYHSSNAIIITDKGEKKWVLIAKNKWTINQMRILNPSGTDGW